MGTPGLRRRFQTPRPKSSAKITLNPATRMPDSPTNRLLPRVEPLKAPWMMEFQAACIRIAGQTLPDSRRSRPTKYPAETMETMNSDAESSGKAPEAYCPLKINGTCQKPQIKPLVSTGFGTRASTKRVSR